MLIFFLCDTYCHNNIDQQFSASQHRREYVLPDERSAYRVLFWDMTTDGTRNIN